MIKNEKSRKSIKNGSNEKLLGYAQLGFILIISVKFHINLTSCLSDKVPKNYGDNEQVLTIKKLKRDATPSKIGQR